MTCVDYDVFISMLNLPKRMVNMKHYIKVPCKDPEEHYQGILESVWSKEL